MDRVLKNACVSCCDTCADRGRREWLQTAVYFGIGLSLLGLSSAEAVAVPVSAIDGVQSGSERRYPVPAADSVNIDHAAQLIVARYHGQLFVFALSCPHQNNAVKWVANDHRFQCTKHDSQYSPDGTHTAGRATRNLDRYVIRRDGDSVVVDLHQWVQSDKDPVGWAAAAITVS